MDRASMNDRWNYIDHGPDGEETCMARVLVTRKGMSREVVSMCGEVYRDNDSWCRGFSFGEKPSQERVTCPKCLERMREEYA